MSDSRLTRAGDTGGATAKTFPPSDHEAITKAARGIADRTATTLSFDAGTRRFTITPTNGAWSYYIAGRRYIKSAAESIIIADTSGLHWIYYDGATLSEEINPSHDTLITLIEDAVRVGLVLWNATDGAAPMAADDRHGPGMPGEVQEWLHTHIGTVWDEGLALSGYTLDSDVDADVQFEMSDGGIHDEDLHREIVDGNPANQYEQQLNGADAEIPILYRDDVDGSWTEDAATVRPYKRFGAGRLAYNKDDGDGTFSQVEVTDNKFVGAFLYATSDWQYPIKMIQGQHAHADKKTAFEEISDDILALGALPNAEMVLLYAFTMQTKDTFGGTNKCKIVGITDVRRLSVSGGLLPPAEAHAILSDVHSDSVPADVVRGDLFVGNATPEWNRLAVGAAGTFLGSDGTDPAWNGTVVTAAAVIADNALVRGAGGARGVQNCGVAVSDTNVMSGLTDLLLDKLRLEGTTLSVRAGASDSLYLSTLAGWPVQIPIAGIVSAHRDALLLTNSAWHSSMIGTGTSLAFRQAYTSGGDLDYSARITAAAETNWTGAPGNRDSYMAFQVALNGTVAEKMRITSAGVVGINTTDPVAYGVNTQFAVHREASSCNMVVVIESNTAGHRPIMQFKRSRGTEAIPLAVQSGDQLGAFLAAGYDGSAFDFPANIVFIVDGAVGSGSVPTSIVFETGAPARTERFRLGSDGHILVDSATELRIRDSGLRMHSSVDGQLDIDADGEVEITSGTIELNAAVVYVPTANGIDYVPGGDLDVDLITLSVTGTPRFWWDESEDEFATTKHLNIAGGWSGTFTNGDGDTVTVQDGVITGVV